MRLKGDYLLPVSLSSAWTALNDTELLKSAIPGCQSITLAADQAETSEDRLYDLLMLISVGPVHARLVGTLQLRDPDPPHAYTLFFSGDAGAAGSGEATAAVTLTPVEASLTRLRYEADAEVGGRIARVGSVIVRMAARRIADHFFARFADVLLQKQSAD